MILVINETIDSGTPQKVADFLNRIPQDEIKLEHFIYLQSRGGNCSCAEVINHLINKSEFGITLVGFGQLCSCAFDLFFNHQGRKMLTKGTIGMYHHSSINVDIHENNKPDYTEDKAKLIYLTGHMRQETSKMMKMLNFTAIEVKKVRSGKDVWFQPERMHEFLKTVNK